MQRVSSSEISVNSHANQPMEASRLFCNVPSEIGPLQSAFSTLQPGKIPWLGWLGALLMAAVCGALGCIFAYMIVYFDGPTWLYPLFATPCFLGTLYLYAPTARITYVGEKGIFIWQRKLGKESEQTLLFTPELRLHVRVSRNFNHGIYTGTDYGFAFLMPRPEEKLIIGGMYFSLKDNIPSGNEFHFGKSAERAYTQALQTPLMRDLWAGKSREFPIENGPLLTLSSRGITFTQKEKTEEIPLAELASVSVNDGYVTIWRKGGKAGFLGIGRDGVYRFEYAAFPNAQLFFRALGTMLGL